MLLSCLSKVNEYKVSTLYTAGALASSAAYEIYDQQTDDAEQGLSRDMILGFLYASILTTMMTFMAREGRPRLLTSVATLTLWLGRMISGIMNSGFKDMIEGEDESLLFWCVTLCGAVASVVSLIGQYMRYRKERREQCREVEPVKLRFVV